MKPAKIYTNPIALRIVAGAHAAKMSLRELSRRADLSETTATKVCDRLEKDLGDVGIDTLTALAGAMGKSLVWLMYGTEERGGIVVRDLPGWADAAREAVERLGVSMAVADAIGSWTIHAAPPRVDGLFVAGLARTFNALG